MAKSTKPTPKTSAAKSKSAKPGVGGAKSKSASTSAKKPAQKASSAKVSSPKASASKPAKKAATPAKSAAKTSASKVSVSHAKDTAKKPVPAKALGKPATKAPEKPAKVDAKAAESAKKGAAPVAAPAANSSTSGKQGITVVTPKPMKKPKPKALEMPIEPLIRPGMKWKPLIASGPKAPPSTGIPGVAELAVYKADPKARMNKKDLDHYRKVLLDKRAELVGDISNMEDEALRQNSGSLSTLPQHMAEQGSDTFDQSLSLDLAQVDRHLLKEIDAALSRIDEGTYGICERTGKRIAAERLAELPWARYSIEAAREMERRSSSSREESHSDDDSL